MSFRMRNIAGVCFALALTLVLIRPVAAAEASVVSPFSFDGVASPALQEAASPTFEQSLNLRPEPPVALATHAWAEAALSNISGNEVEAIYRAEYSTTGKEGKCEASEAGSRQLVNEDRIPLKVNNTEFVSIGQHDPEQTGGDIPPWHELLLRHLQTQTTYYVRFLAIASAGPNETWDSAVQRLGEQAILCQEVKLTTLAPQKPEVSATTGEIGKANPARQSRISLLTSMSARFRAQIESNGSATEYKFEYMPAKGGEWKEFSVGGSGTVSLAEEYVNHEAEITGLEPETEYRARVTMTNGQGTATQASFFGPAGSNMSETFITPTAKPRPGELNVVNPRATTARLFAVLNPNGSEATWHFELAPSSAGPWTTVAGAEGKTEALPEGQVAEVEADATGLQSGKKYAVRLSAANSHGELHGEAQGFETAGPPAVSTNQVHALDTSGVRLLADVSPGSSPTDEEQVISLEGAPTSGSYTLAFEGQTTRPIPYNATSDEVYKALSVIPRLGGGPGVTNIKVVGNSRGPYVVVWQGEDSGVNVPQLTATGSGVTVHVETRQQGGEGYEEKTGFEYVTQAQYEASGFAEAQSTPEQPLVDRTQEVQHLGAEVPGLQAGRQYQYRAFANSTFPGGEHVVGETVALSVPSAGTGGESPCPNSGSRVGFTASLPDCRAYEQVTPLDKEGAQEAFNYGPRAESGALVGEEGEHLAFEGSAVDWGTAATSGQSPYLFSRESGKAWEMLAGSQQPETGVQRIVPELVSDDASRVAFEADVHTSLGSGESPEVSFLTGSIGGPYGTAAVVPRSDLRGASDFYEGWVAASANFNTLILQVEDHNLLGASTGTKSGDDLYEYAGGELRQVNVGVGTCGANIVSGAESHGVRSSSNAVSADGSRVFFEAVPGSECSGTPHLYMRKDGSETVDLGAYVFAGANPAGTELLLFKQEGGIGHFYVDDFESGSPVGIYSPTDTTYTRYTGYAFGNEVVLSEDFDAIYFQRNDGELFRYGMAEKRLSYLFHVGEISGGASRVIGGRTTPDGRFYYLEGNIGGVPGEGQVFLYDNKENSVDCVSCASSFDPQPRLLATFPHTVLALGLPTLTDGRPEARFLSTDGRFAFFDTPSALLPEDVDQEVAPTGDAGAELQSAEYSPSSDVYEWRAEGVDGCDQLQGCLALITNGRGGYLNLVLGIDRSGSNVFIYTRSQLLSQDKDNAGDIYDVRIDGGLPEPAGPAVECVADACIKPVPAPNDATPASATFNGPGNQPAADGGNSKATTKSTSTKKKKKHSHKSKRKKRKHRGRRFAVKAAHRNKHRGLTRRGGR